MIAMYVCMYVCIKGTCHFHGTQRDDEGAMAEGCIGHLLQEIFLITNHIQSYSNTYIHTQIYTYDKNNLGGEEICTKYKYSLHTYIHSACTGRQPVWPARPAEREAARKPPAPSGAF